MVYGDKLGEGLSDAHKILLAHVRSVTWPVPDNILTHSPAFPLLSSSRLRAMISEGERENSDEKEMEQDIY